MESAEQLTTGVAVDSRRSLPRAGRVFVDLLDRHLADASVRFVLGDDEDDGEIVAGARGPDGGALPDAVTLRIHRDRFFARAITQGNLGMGEAYMDGDFTVVGPVPLHRLVADLLRNRLDQKLRGDARGLVDIFLLQIANLVRRRQWAHVQRHYDVGPEFFELFLGSTMTYSCGYAKSPDDDLESLQQNKLRRICDKLELKAGERLLDIGCGYGGLLSFAATHYGVHGVGITNSRDHCQEGTRRVAAAGLSDRVSLELRDHRSIAGRFDKVVSVGMLEHLPQREYRRYFDRIAEVLEPRGLGLVHAIGSCSPRLEHDRFIQKYIFPGSGQMLLSKVACELERHRMLIRDVENIVRHYGYTVLRWLEGLTANADRLDPQKYDQRFRRMFEYFFHCGIGGAFAGDGAVYQVLFARDYSTAMPLQRV